MPLLPLTPILPLLPKILDWLWVALDISVLVLWVSGWLGWPCTSRSGARGYHSGTPDPGPYPQADVPVP